METVTGIFDSREHAEHALSRLATEAKFSNANLLLITPDASPKKIGKIPTDEGEQPGMGSALGGVIGGAVGLATGVVLSNLVLPGIGPVLTLSLSAGTGLGGALIGAAGGSAAERGLSNGLPKDEIFFYEDALRCGHSVVMAMAHSDEAADQARSILERNGAESIDAAREKWWIGIRETEAEEFCGAQGDSAAHERIYRAGFEAALHPELRDKNLSEAESVLERRYPQTCRSDAFRRGYERGREYHRTLSNQSRESL